jgi:hypothetical protein
MGERDMPSSTPQRKGETRSTARTRIEAEGGLDRSLINMVQFYGDSLRALLKGETSLESVPLGNRKRFLASGIIRRFGSRYELTEIGSRLLHHTKT